MTPTAESGQLLRIGNDLRISQLSNRITCRGVVKRYRYRGSEMPHQCQLLFRGQASRRAGVGRSAATSTPTTSLIKPWNGRSTAGAIFCASVNAVTAAKMPVITSAGNETASTRSNLATNYWSSKSFPVAFRWTSSSWAAKVDSIRSSIWLRSSCFFAYFSSADSSAL